MSLAMLRPSVPARTGWGQSTLIAEEADIILLTGSPS